MIICSGLYVGAIDSTHIIPIFSSNEQISSIERKDIPTQNITTIRDFSVFRFWEGLTKMLNFPQPFLKIFFEDNTKLVIT